MSKHFSEAYGIELAACIHDAETDNVTRFELSKEAIIVSRYRQAP